VEDGEILYLVMNLMVGGKIVAKIFGRIDPEN
jgi:hypothetical protein